MSECRYSVKVVDEFKRPIFKAKNKTAKQLGKEMGDYFKSF